MADFDDLINDAENFENDYNDEPDIPDEFLQEKVIESKKRVLENDQSHSNETDKRVKPAGCLADYFVNNNQSPSNDNGSKTVKNSNQQSNYSNQQSNYSNQQSNNTNQQSKGNHDNSQQSNYGTNTNTSVNNNESATVEEKGPLCACGMKSVSKTTFKEGPNKDRKFWICGQDRDSQCKFFEWRDALNSFDSEAPNQQQQFKSTGPNVFDEEKGPLCQCGQGSISKTTFKEGANKDRKFWVCGQDYDSKCKFFEWRDTPKPQAQSMGSNSMNHQQQQQQQKPISAGPQCKCGIPCVSRTTTKEGPNQGKAFWVCTAQQGSQCKFFEWAVPEGQNNQGGNGNRPNYNNNNNSNGNSNNYGNNNNYGGNNNGNNNYGNNNNGGNNSYGNNNNGNNSNYGNNNGGSNTQKSGTCFKCGEAGHWSTNCPKQGGGGGGGYKGGGGGGGYKKY